MTNKKRTTIMIPDELDAQIYALRQTDEFVRCSYSEIVRNLVELGLRAATPAQQRDSA